MEHVPPHTCHTEPPEVIHSTSSSKMPEMRSGSRKRQCSQELFCHKRTNPVNLRRGMEKMEETAASGLRETKADHFLNSSSAASLAVTTLKHLPRIYPNDRASYIYLLKDRFVIVDIIDFHNNLGSTCQRMGPSRGIIISSCDTKYIFCPLQLRKRTCTKSN